MSSLSPINLDYTLHDLYATASEDDAKTVLIYYPLQFGRDHESTPSKFAYGYRVENEDEGVSSTLAMAAKMVPQRYAFSAGKMPLVILDFTILRRNMNTETRPTSSVPIHHLDIYQTFAQLNPEQRPVVSFADGQDNIKLDANARIAVLLPTDCLSHLPHLTCPETHYEILSKRGLAVSGLPTPHSQIIDTVLVDSGDPGLLTREIVRMTDPITQHEIPFMVKLPQSISGMGTFAVTSETKRTQIKARITTQLGAMLRQLNYTNAHLHPCSIVLQDFVPGPVVALTMFVAESGHPIFIACCDQLFDENSHWIGGSISYRQQEGFRKKFGALMAKVAVFLHRKGYHGPAGIDIVTDRRNGEQLVIDLNARVTGTFHLGPLAGHFTQRGLFEAAMTTGDIYCSREKFEEFFAEDMHRGSLIVSGWVHDESRRYSHAAITVGAADSDGLQDYLRRVRDFGLQS
ncbi:hypothetical protein VI817_000010 [Penicillium citrinum]|nr:hypothetical protein VI817_000010 [Penicillium citrinum]